MDLHGTSWMAPLNPQGKHGLLAPTMHGLAGVRGVVGRLPGAILGLSHDFQAQKPNI